MLDEKLGYISDVEKIDYNRNFFYENAFYLTATPARIRKFLVHYELFKMILNKAGDIVECGVFKGASLSRFLKFRAVFNQVKDKKVIGFDVFGKFPMPEDRCKPEDLAGRDNFVNEAGEYSISREKLAEFLNQSGVLENVRLVKGDVCQTLPEYIKQNPDLQIALLNVDIDLYKPTYDCLKYLYPKVVKGGVVILDDYQGFEGATKAIDEFFADKKDVKIEKFFWASSPHYVVKV